MGQCSFLLTVLAFRCPLSVYSQIESAKNTLSRHQPTNPDPGSVSTTSVQNKQPPAPNASNQNNQSTQTGVKKFSSPKRTPTRHSAAKDFSVWRRACFIMAPKTGSKKLVETWRPERDLDCMHKRISIQSIHIYFFFLCIDNFLQEREREREREK